MDSHYTLSNNKQIFSAPGSQITTVGQLEGCDVQIENRTPYEDILFAKIVPDNDGEGWHLLRCSRHAFISINGLILNRVHYLKDGDILVFGKTSFRFNIRKGVLPSPAIVHLYKNNRLMWGAMAVLTCLLVIIGYHIYDSSKEKLTPEMQNEIEASLYTLHIDSIHLVHRDTVIDTYIYASSPTGTAFLTTDSLMVTARHCLQPWLNQVAPFEYARIPETDSWSVEKALFVETSNQLADNNEYQLISYLTLTDESGVSTAISSDDFIINYDSDEIVDVGDFEQPLYWRSISHRYSRKAMMLGDIAVARFNKKGNIALATATELRSLLKKAGAAFIFFGHPESGVNGSRLDMVEDRLRVPLQELDEEPGRIFMLSHGGALSPGFSGGPVIMRDGKSFKAVGVISVIDDKNDNRSYSVPTSEIDLILKK